MNSLNLITFTVLVVATLGGPAWSQTTKPAPPADFTIVGDAGVDPQGLITWTLSSPYQVGENGVKVLVPDAAGQTKARFPVIYLLQVGPDFGAWGNPIIEAKKLDLHNKFKVIFVLPAFKAVKSEQLAGHGGGPWYADHPTDPNIRHESYVVRSIVPFIDRKYPALAEPRGRLLLGFSMSGCGAFNLLLRHPDVFGKAAAWDAPSAWTWWKPEPGQDKARFAYGPKLIEENAGMLKAGASRLAVLGFDVYRAQAESVHQQLLSLKIPHDYNNDKQHKHGWNSGWLASAVETLCAQVDP